ncbi:SIMPL domain-containing protein [Corynebacterium sp. YIM 101645]|uniref:SIMPL domain-containing protein n=1 Tax=Corynebacterium lemuris TaxID=1859292 RepID=A0ABT2FT89_9CORY|nr:SIMPL domain-containing protein [Corynebacterium lemuris]MCS5478440.1 SIMPL domain-containing protein [Corynebacterium lemuris]
MDHIPTVRCTGTAVGEFPADTASVRLRVNARHAHQEGAYRLRQEGLAVARAVLGAVSGVEISEESLGEHTWDSHTVATWECAVTAVGGVDGLREVIARLADVPSVEVLGPTWRLSEVRRRELRERLQVTAVQDARREAGLLAAALGVRAGAPQRIDSGDAPHLLPEMRMVGMDMAQGSDLPPRTLELDLTPELITLEESVTVDFALEQEG